MTDSAYYNLVFQRHKNLIITILIMTQYLILSQNYDLQSELNLNYNLLTFRILLIMMHYSVFPPSGRNGLP